MQLIIPILETEGLLNCKFQAETPGHYTALCLVPVSFTEPALGMDWRFERHPSKLIGRFFLKILLHQKTVDPLIAFVSFYRDGTKVLETDALEASPYVNHSIQTIPLHFAVDLQHLSPGTYDCQATVLDLSHRMTAFSRTSVAVVP